MRRVLVAGAVLGVGIQLVPYGWHHPNPPVESQVAWPDDEIEGLLRTACYDCHSNETEWPAYSYVAPMSWLVRRDVEAGREELNWSEGDDDFDDAAETIAEGSMPPRTYTLAHPGARLSDEERTALVAALQEMDERD